MKGILLFLFFLGSFACGYELSIAAIFKNEAPYLKEWVEYHRMVGVEHFWLYNDSSTDQWEEVLAPYIEEGVVEVIDWPIATIAFWIPRQIEAYVDALNKTKDITKWLAFIDLDEYLLPMHDHTVIECLNRHYPDAKGVYVSWRNFGTGGITLMPGESLLYELTACSTRNHFRNNTGKSIVQPRYVLSELTFTPHHFPLKAGCQYYNGDGEVIERRGHDFTMFQTYDKFIRINHYNTRDEKFFREVKLPRQKAMGEEDLLWKLYHDFSQEFDDTIIQFIQTKHPRNYWSKDPYLEICQQAATDPSCFSQFRSLDAFAQVTEIANGEKFASHLLKHGHPSVLEKMDAFSRLDEIGNPFLNYYPKLGIFSGTTLRYITIGDHIKKLFSLPQDANIVEIGGGFGGQCYVLSQLFPFSNYSIFDLAEPCQLIEKVLTTLNISNISYYGIDAKYPHEKIDLVISHSSFTSQLLKKAENGYVIFNETKGLDEFVQRLKKEGLHPQVLQEPIQDNALVIWTKKKHVDIVANFSLDELSPEKKIAEDTGFFVRSFFIDFDQYYHSYFSKDIDAVIVMNQTGPAIEKIPKEKLILFTWEPGGAPLSEINKFSKVFTFNDTLIDQKTYFKFSYPVLTPLCSDIPPFEQKKLCAMVCHSPTPERVKIARFFDAKPFDDFDLYGFFPIVATAHYKGRIPGHPLSPEKFSTLRNYRFTICFENSFIPGYITEKIFSCFASGTVPIYYGAPNVHDYIPKECFIDYRDFPDDEALYKYMKTMPKEKYQSYRTAIENYLQSPKSLLFSATTFNKTLQEAVCK